MTANPEAIAWYLVKAEELLGELRQEIDSLHSRGAQLGGFSGAVLALAGTNADSLLESLSGPSKVFAGTSLLVGSLLLVAALATGLRGTLRPRAGSGASAREIANYASERFTTEPDLWRVQIRAIHSWLLAIEVMTQQANKSAQGVGKAEYFFLIGLFLVGIAFATLIGVVTF